MEPRCAAPYIRFSLKGFDMKLNLQKFLMAAATVGAVALAGCSDGDSGPNTVASTTVSATDTASVTAFNAVADALTDAGTSIAVGGATGTVGATTVTLPLDTKLVFTPTTASSLPSAVSDFTLTSGTQVLAGSVTPGSCVFTVTSVSGSGFFSAALTQGSLLKFEPCKFETNTAGVVVNTPTNKSLTITLGGQTFTTTVIVKVKPDGTVMYGNYNTGIKVDITTTGATGGTGASS